MPSYTGQFAEFKKEFWFQWNYGVIEDIRWAVIGWLHKRKPIICGIIGHKPQVFGFNREYKNCTRCTA